MTSPRPGKPVRGSNTGRPIMVALDLLGRRWCLRILWEIRDRPLKFRDLQEAAGGISPTVLNTRLRELRDAGVVAHSEGLGFQLTDSGRALMEALQPLSEWARRWAPAHEAEDDSDQR